MTAKTQRRPTCRTADVLETDGGWLTGNQVLGEWQARWQGGSESTVRRSLLRLFRGGWVERREAAVTSQWAFAMPEFEYRWVGDE
jgi:hypothetical protein